MSEHAPSRRDVLRIGAVVGLGSAFGGATLAALLRDARLHRISQTRTAMGTLVTMTVVHPDASGAQALLDRAFGTMLSLEGDLTRHRADAPLGRLNRSGRIDQAPPALHTVLDAALRLAVGTGGAFDPTVLPVLRLWERGEGRSRSRPGTAPSRGTPPEMRPSDVEIADALRRVDFRAVRRVGDGFVLDMPGMGLTLDGIAKGYVVDRTVDVLAAGGAERIMVDAGGDIATGGPGSEGEPWTFAVQDPRDDRRAAGLLRLDGSAVATSGDYLRNFSADRTHHPILDPRTGRSPTEVAAVSVVAPDAMRADALSTALMVLGTEAGMRAVEGLDGVEAMIIDKQGIRTRSDGFPQIGV